MSTDVVPVGMSVMLFGKLVSVGSIGFMPHFVTVGTMI